MAFGNKSKLKMGSKVLEVIKFLLKVVSLPVTFESPYRSHYSLQFAIYINTLRVYFTYIYFSVFYNGSKYIEKPLVKRIFYIKPSSCFYERVVYS